MTLFLPILIGSFVVVSELDTTKGALLSKNAQDVIEAERLNSLINQEFALVQAFVLRGSQRAIDQLAIVHRDFHATVGTLLLNLDAGETPDLLQEILTLEDEGFALAQRAVQLKERGASIAQLNAFFESANLTRGSRILVAVRDNVSLQTLQLNQAREEADRLSKHLVWGLFAACAFSLLATAAVIILLYQTIRSKARQDQERDEKLKLQEKISTARKEAVEVVAHDLKNPLSSLKMSVELLRGELSDQIAANPDVAMGFQIAERSVGSMQRLIDDQLDHTKIESGQLVIERVLSNLGDLLSETDLRFQPLAAAKRIRLKSQIDRGLIAQFDPVRMEQVLSNLLGNALKFTPEGGAIELIGRRTGDTISIVVRDSGPGIPKDALGHIFERYWQVRETAKNGTGLGLSIAKGIVEAHGGKLTCKSEVGRGSEFEIRLQAAALNLSAAETTH